jgi:DNA adenine methylase
MPTETKNRSNRGKAKPAAAQTIAPKSDQAKPVAKIPSVVATAPQHRSTTSKAFFRLAGSKGRLVRKLIPLMPDHIRYVALFGGSGADILFKPRSKVEIFNDLNKDGVNAFAVLRSNNNRKTLYSWLQFSPYSRLQFSECLGILHSDEPDPVKRAWAFLYCSLTRFGGVDPGICTSGNFTVPKTHGLRSDWHNVVERIESVGRRFRDVVLENQTWEEIVARYDSATTFFYCDPPYVLSTRTGRLYQHEMTDKQHAALLDALRQVTGCVMLSGYDSDLYRERLANWRRVDFEVKCSISPATTKPRRVESVWMNYTRDGKRLQG